MKLPHLLKNIILFFVSCFVLILGRYLVDAKWDVPRVGFSLLLFFFFAVFLQRWAAVGASLALEGLLLAVSNVKQAASLEPLLGIDLFNAGQGMALTGYIDQQIVAYAFMTILSIALGLYYFPGFSKYRLVLGIILCGILAAQLNQSHYSVYVKKLIVRHFKVSYSPFNFIINIQDNGILGHLILTAEAIYKPKVGQHNFYDVYLPPSENAHDPDVFIVMCESCYTSQDDRFVTQMETLSNKGFSKSKVISPVYGGSTPEAEFEVLTGLSSFALPGVGFQNFGMQFSDRVNALPSHYVRAGYSTMGMHNFLGDFWRRSQVYPKLGFQRMAFIEDMKGSYTGWPSDEILYKHALNQYKHASKGEKQFVFLVTVMTHGPYLKQNDNGLNSYQEGMKTAIDLFGKFVDSLEVSAKARGREIVIVIFGDHKPSLTQDFRDAGILEQDFSSPELQKEGGFKRKISMREKQVSLGEVPLYIRYSHRQFEAVAIAKRLQDRPLFCISAEMARLTINSDPFFDALSDRCEKNTGFYDKEFWWRDVFPEELYAERLFTK